MQVVPQHVRPRGHVPVEEHGPPPLSGAEPASEPPLDEPLDEPPELLELPELPPEDPLEDPLLPLLEDEPLLEPEPPDDEPPDPDSVEASELPCVEPDPPQATVDESQTRDAPRIHACFKQAAIVSSPRRVCILVATGARRHGAGVRI